MKKSDVFSVKKKKNCAITYVYRISMVRDKPIPYDADITGSQQSAEVIRNTIGLCGQNDREHFVIIMLNDRNSVMGTNIVSVGTVGTVNVYLREVFKPVIAASATGIILGHNHPSGRLEPSKEDVGVTIKIKNIAELLEVRVFDHVIVDMASNAYYSFCDAGLIKQL